MLMELSTGSPERAYRVLVLEQDRVLEGAPEEGMGPVQDVAESLDFFERLGVRPGPSSVADVSVLEGGHAVRRRPGGKEGE